MAEDFYEHMKNGFDNPDIHSRMGKFHLSRAMMQNNPGDIARVMQLMAVFRCESMMAYDSFEYWALSPLFEPIERGMTVPEYSIEFSEGMIRARKI